MKNNNILEKERLIQTYQTIRKKTEALCTPLTIEDYVIQTIIDVSPPKWHLAHTSWFFETFILLPYLKNYKVFDPTFHYLFNSYYQGLGTPYLREKRGFLSRPTVETIYLYRNYVDEHLIHFLTQNLANELNTYLPLLILGLHHEQQHQELLLMDIKYNFFQNPTFPIFNNTNQIKKTNNAHGSNAMNFIYNPGGLIEIGNNGEDFCFDNELPRHKKFITSYHIANRLVTNAEFSEFIADNGYQQAKWWLSDGWDYVIKNNLIAPLYWHKIDDTWYQFTLSGLVKLESDEPVAHISYFEADAYARWQNKRLPTEEEWENFVAQQQLLMQGNFMETGLYQPQPADVTTTPQQFFGDLWEWTSSSYAPYPGFKPLRGALGEYNGKFMNNQMVLRGGCCATPETHIRSTYRNFFQPEKRWQFSGIRLAADAKDE